jgi:hypothetical protein
MILLDPRRKSPPSPPSDPTALILACHTKIRAFVAMGERLADATNAPAEEIASAATSLRKYFTDALPLHELDEEQSVTPRLLASSERARLEDAILTMVGEHAAAHAILDEIDPLWARLIASPGDLPAIRARLVPAQRALALLFEAHLEGEERVIVPAIAAVLPPEERDAIAREIRARRG